MTNRSRYWRTGIPELDELLFDGRGFRDGRGYIISGPPQSGKTILAMCLVKSMIAQGGAITYMTIGRPAKDLVELYQEFSIDVNNYLETMDLVILDWATIRLGGDIKRTRRQLGQYLSERAIANIRFGVDPCNKEEYLDRITEIHKEKATFHGKPGIGVVDAISDQVVLLNRKGLPGSIVSEIYFTARQRFSMEEPGIAFHLFAPLEERVSHEYSVLLEDLHLNEDGTINLAFEFNEEGEIINRSMWIRSLYGSKAPNKRLYFNITVEDRVRITDSVSQPSPSNRMHAGDSAKSVRQSARLIEVYEIDEFQRIGDISETTIPEQGLAGIRSLDEEKELEPLIQEILYDPDKTPHGPTEIADILTTCAHVNGERRIAAFVLKGKSYKKVVSRNVTHQFAKVRQVPNIGLMVLVAVGQIQDDAKRDFFQSAQDAGCDFLIIDTRDCWRLLVTYGKICPKDGSPWNKHGLCKHGHRREDEI